MLTFVQEVGEAIQVNNLINKTLTPLKRKSSCCVQPMFYNRTYILA